MEGCRLTAVGNIEAAGSVAHELATNGAKFISIGVENTGANNITAVEFRGSPLGSVFGVDGSVGTAFGTIAPGVLAAKTVTVPASSLVKILVSLSSTAGTSYKLEVRGGY
jgi:hypothetical protein